MPNENSKPFDMWTNADDEMQRWLSGCWRVAIADVPDFHILCTGAIPSCIVAARATPLFDVSILLDFQRPDCITKLKSMLSASSF